MSSIGSVSWWACKFCNVREMCVMRKSGLVHAKVEGDMLVCEWFQDDGWEDEDEEGSVGSGRVASPMGFTGDVLPGGLVSDEVTEIGVIR